MTFDNVTENILRENRQIVTDYLLNLPEDELIQIVSEHLGEEATTINYDYAMMWVDAMTDDEVEDVFVEMGGHQVLMNEIKMHL